MPVRDVAARAKTASPSWQWRNGMGDNFLVGDCACVSMRSRRRGAASGIITSSAHIMRRNLPAAIMAAVAVARLACGENAGLA